MNFRTIPEELKKLKRWVNWKLEERTNSKGEKKWTKPPYSPAGVKISITDINNLDTFYNVCNATGNGKGFNGIGFAFFKDDPFVGIDFDHVIDEQGNVDPDIKNWLDKFPSYTEYSQSKKGLHIICKGKKPDKNCRKGNIEIYEAGRYFAITGDIYNSKSEITDCQKAIEEFSSSVFKEEKKEAVRPVTGQTGLLDYEIINLCGKAKNGNKFNALMHGDFTEYPSQSEADLALCSILSFYTQDESQIDNIFRQSRLYRDKWNEKHGDDTYGNNTIKKALSGLTETYSPGYGKAVFKTSSPVDIIPGTAFRETGETTPGHEEEKKEEYPPLVGFTLKELMEEEFPPLKFLVQDILPEGLTILAGKPKIGKSILALNLSMSIAKGCLTLGKLSTEKTEVAYFALEDNKRRLKKRALPILKENFPENFTFFNSLLPLTKGGYEQLNSYLDSHPEVKFIVIDTIGRIKPPSYSGNSYEVDTQLYSKLHDIYLKRNVSVLVITHTKKQEALDFIDNVTGSAGSTGVADTVLVLSKNRTEKEAVLKVTGRDIEEEQELALRLNSDLFSWEILGSAEFYTQSKERKEIIDILLREEMPMTNKDLQGLLNKNYNAIRFLTWKMEKDGILLKINNSYVISPSYVITSTNTANSANTANTANSANSIESVSDIVSSVSLEKNTANTRNAIDTNGKNTTVSDASGVSGKVTCKSCEYFNPGHGGLSAWGSCKVGGGGGYGSVPKNCRFYIKKEEITETPF